MALFAGVAREKITPEVGGFLFGYNDQTKSDSIHDDLNATALALKSGDTSVIIISIDVCLIHNTICEEIRSKIAAETGIPANNVILSPSHTHSGPRTMGFGEFGNWGTIDEEYCKSIFIPKCIAAGKAAVSKMVSVKMGTGTTESKVGINRRQLLRDNTVTLGQNPWDTYDPTMTVISLVSADKECKPVANVVHVGAHCTASGINHEVTRDWAGVMVDRLERESGALTLFINGTSGDVAPRMANGGSTGDIQHAMEVGGLAGIDAVRAFKTIRTYYDEPLETVYGDLTLPFKPPLTEEYIANRLETYDSDRPLERSSLERLAKLYESGDLGPDTWTMHQTIVRLGPVVMVPFPFETSSEIGLRLRAYSSFAHTLLLGNANGSNSYLPAESQICRGGYEIESFKWFRPRQLPDDSDKQLINQNMSLIEKL